jgi:hypothetical protein
MLAICDIQRLNDGYMYLMTQTYNFAIRPHTRRFWSGLCLQDIIPVCQRNDTMQCGSTRRHTLHSFATCETLTAMKLSRATNSSRAFKGTV